MDDHLVERTKFHFQNRHSSMGTFIYHDLVDLTGSYNAAAVIGQLFWLSGRYADENGWFYHSSSQWEIDLHMKGWTIRNHLNEFQKLGLVEVSVRKIPNKTTATHFLVNWEAVTKMVESRCVDPDLQITKSGFGKNPNRDLGKTKILLKDVKERKVKERKEDKTEASPKAATPPRVILKSKSLNGQPQTFNKHTGFDISPPGEQSLPPKTPGKLEQSTRKLHAHLTTTKRIKRNASFTKWLKDVRELITSEEISPSEFSSVIDWYVEHSEDEFMPQVFSAQSFCEKWNKIIHAKRRQEKADGRKVGKSNGGVSDAEKDELNKWASERGIAKAKAKKEESEKKGWADAGR